MINESYAIVRDCNFISVIDIKRGLCFPIIETKLSNSLSSNDLFLEVNVIEDKIEIHTFNNDLPDTTQMARYEVPTKALFKFVECLY